ncbi:FliH/SctL family protein [Stenotrophomonas sp. Marseille-Q4652]|uniref:FliH/SctL family protein n=1 Tax=Stenotrophomonas sp. Marseille-Q4652 TaxID=2866595 RepID=UPI001CE3D03A|nr:FliH/SctL family protein [Stenotrophomonas sp. Marseille-Q4652]
MSNVVRWIAPDLMATPDPELEAEELQADEAWLGDEPEPEPETEPALKPPTLEEIEAIQNAAQQEGFERGHADGYAQGQAEVRRLIAQIEGILDNFSRPLVRLENEVVGALGELSVRIAGNLVGRAYEAEPELLQDLVLEALDAVGSTSRDVEVRLHPDDIAALAPLLNLGPGHRLNPDPSLSRGDLRVHAESVRIDGTMEARLRAALATVMRRSEAEQ